LILILKKHDEPIISSSDSYGSSEEEDDEIVIKPRHSSSKSPTKVNSFNNRKRKSADVEDLPTNEDYCDTSVKNGPSRWKKFKMDCEKLSGMEHRVLRSSNILVHLLKDD